MLRCAKFPNVKIMASIAYNFNLGPDIITYLFSSRPYIEICRVCKIYWTRGGAESSIDFTNPTYFHVRSGTDQISVLFCRGLLFVYAVLRKIKFIRTADKLTTSMLARKWRDVTLWRHWHRFEDQGLTLTFWWCENQGKSNIYLLGFKMCGM